MISGPNLSKNVYLFLPVMNSTDFAIHRYFIGWTTQVIGIRMEHVFFYLFYYFYHYMLTP